MHEAQTNKRANLHKQKINNGVSVKTIDDFLSPRSHLFVANFISIKYYILLFLK